MKLKRPVAERRKWPRLPLAIPVFVRGKLQQEKEFLEFATALNVSAGGMLLAVRHALPTEEEVSLEIPCPPLSASANLPNAARTLVGKVLRIQHSNGYNLLGLKFLQPVVGSAVRARTQRRKQPALV